MNSNTVPSTLFASADEIREILVRRIDQQKQALGIVVGVIEPRGRTVVAHPRTVDGDTIFEIGSVSKIFTSLLLADMVHRGEVALDDLASSHLPASVKVPAVTLHDLSTHTSGLPNLPSNFKPQNPRNPYADYSVDDLYRFLSDYTLPRDPGSQFEYSNLGVGLLGHILACRAGTDYASLVRSRITKPLGMADTAITLSTSMQQRMATGHTAMLAPAPYWDFAVLTGAGGLRSSAHDMLTLLEAFLGYKESPLEPAMRMMFEVRRPVAKMGLGWIMMSAHDREIACHDGGTGGFRAWIGCDPKERTGVVVLSNAATPIGVFDIGIHLLDSQWPLANIEPPQERAEIRLDPSILDHYTGRYQMAPNVIFEVSRDGDRLFGQTFVQALAGPKFEMFAEGEKAFFARVANNQFTFETNSEGQSTKLILHKAGRDIPAPRCA